MNNRLLGTLAMLTAPAMLAETFISNGTINPLVVGIASMLFMFGSFCSHVGLWQLRATGTNWWGRGVLVLQLLLVTLAFWFGFLEATKLVGETHPLFMITDIAWPLSMVTQNLVGVTVAVVGGLPSWRRFAPLLCGLALPVTLGAVLILGLDMQGQAVGSLFFGMLAIGWGLLGWVVRQGNDRPALVAPSVPTAA